MAKRRARGGFHGGPSIIHCDPRIPDDRKTAKSIAKLNEELATRRTTVDDAQEWAAERGVIFQPRRRRIPPGNGKRK